MRKLLFVMLSLALSACSGGVRLIPPPATSASQPPPPPPRPAFRPAPTMRGFGIDSVIGRNAGTLIQRFGPARIDLQEGDARKLQFVSETCVLDIYLYPESARAEPLASHIEARRRDGGAETDRAVCIADVERSANAGQSPR